MLSIQYIMSMNMHGERIRGGPGLKAKDMGLKTEKEASRRKSTD